ncbi:MAG: YcxB family protein [Hydrogeniiclostridium sp.]
MRKRIASALCAVLLALGCAVPAFAAEKTTYTIEEMNITLELPDDLYVFEQSDFNILDPNPDLEKAGFTDPQEQLEMMQEYEIYLTAVSQDQMLSINVAKKDSTTTQSVYDLSQLTDEQFEEFLDTMRGEDDTTDEIEAYEVQRYDDQPERPFFTIRMKMNSEQYGEKEELCYVTVVNGYSITIDGVAEGDMTQEQSDLLREIADSVHVTQIIEQETIELNAATIFSLLFPLVLIVFLIALGVGMRIRRGHAMKERRALADRMSEYRRAQKKLEEEAAAEGRTPEEPETLFRNKTTYNEEVAHAFVQFHFLRRKLGVMIGYAVFALFMAASAFVLDSEWYMRLILFGVGVFLVVWMCLMPGKLYNNVMATFKKAKNKENEYTFRADDFRIAGVQSASVFPYFQVTRAYESGKYFYLYFGEEQAYYIAKDGFTVGDADGFRTFLKEKLGKNFR